MGKDTDSHVRIPFAKDQAAQHTYLLEGRTFEGPRQDVGGKSYILLTFHVAVKKSLCVTLVVKSPAWSAGKQRKQAVVNLTD
jgi:hypothetical protein